METRDGRSFGNSPEFGRPQDFETTSRLPSDAEQRGVRIPASWRPDDDYVEHPAAASRRVQAPQPEGDRVSIPRGRPTQTSRREKIEERPATQNQSEHHPNTIQLLLSYQFKYSMAALAVQAVCMGIGGLLAYSGAIGKTAFAAQALSDFGLKVQMTDAGPGVVLFVVALIAMIATRFSVRIDK
jgi:hypothetical protein